LPAEPKPPRQSTQFGTLVRTRSPLGRPVRASRRAPSRTGSINQAMSLRARHPKLARRQVRQPSWRGQLAGELELDKLQPASKLSGWASWPAVDSHWRPLVVCAVSFGQVEARGRATGLQLPLWVTNSGHFWGWRAPQTLFGPPARRRRCQSRLVRPGPCGRPLPSGVAAIQLVDMRLTTMTLGWRRAEASRSLARPTSVQMSCARPSTPPFYSALVCGASEKAPTGRPKEAGKALGESESKTPKE